MTQTSQKYDLEERTASFAEDVIKICRTIKYNSISNPIVSQLIRSATSIGANYMEANGASSKKDFRNKIYICKKESQETQHWLRMLSTAQPELRDELRTFWQEAHEFVLIFQKITSSLRN
ncbi:MAG: four helix bundle protein [Patescibacteria group bacterium]